MEIFLKLLISVLCGGIIGLERQRRGQYAGFRTQLLVCMGSCLFTVLSIEFNKQFGTFADPARIAAQVVTGIGFLGAGAILRHEHYVRGLTTAASMWAVSAIGLAIGFGAFTPALIATALVLINLIIFKNIENIISQDRYTTLTLRLRGLEPLDLRQLFPDKALKLRQVKLFFLKEQNVVEQHYTVRYNDYSNLLNMVNSLKSREDIINLNLS
ncbi:MAG: MgtC/SapB family protein [Nitrospiraceae bacterium]|nr:MgtC/SapB family protein [Nitrospiraceae bacterium]